MTIETKPSQRSVSAVPEALSEPHSAAEPRSSGLVSESLGVSISMATDNLDDSTYSKTDKSNKSLDISYYSTSPYNARQIYTQKLQATSDNSQDLS